MGSSESTSYTSRSEHDYSKSYDSDRNGYDSHKDSYGQNTYDRYQPSYAGENASGRDEYGNPTYGD